MMARAGKAVIAGKAKEMELAEKTVIEETAEIVGTVETGETVVQKLRNTVGESIAETLIALLISALALIMLAGAVSTATNIVTKSKTTMSNYYEQDNGLANAAGGSDDITVTLTETSVAGGGTAVSQSISSAKYKSNNVFGSVNVVAYAVPTPAPAGL